MVEQSIDTTLPECKVCTGCHLSKQLSEFRNDTAKPSGRSTRCKDCAKLASVERRRLNVLYRQERIALGEVKTCKKCCTDKSVIDFGADQNIPGGTKYICISCETVKINDWRRKNIDHVRRETRRQMRDYYAKNRERYKAASRRSKLKTTYGLTEEDLELLLVVQDRACAICCRPFGRPKPNRNMHVDHDHKTGLVRSLLCSPCNSGIGQFKEDEALFMKAIEYLRRHRAKP